MAHKIAIQDHHQAHRSFDLQPLLRWVVFSLLYLRISFRSEQTENEITPNKNEQNTYHEYHKRVKMLKQNNKPSFFDYLLGCALSKNSSPLTIEGKNQRAKMKVDL